MQRRAPAPTPARPACAECTRLDNLQREADARRDYSRAIDFRVLLRRHRAEQHQAPEPTFEGEQ